MLSEGDISYQHWETDTPKKERNFVLTVKHGYFWAHSLSVGGKELGIRCVGVC